MRCLSNENYGQPMKGEIPAKSAVNCSRIALEGVVMGCNVDARLANAAGIISPGRGISNG